ncbi:methyltransferase domain-containing protein [bacterium]|nr:methyltransferase domain-containing protein [bacterium]
MSRTPDDLPEEYLLGQFIPLHYHFNMLQDDARMLPFQEAIEQMVPVGGKVLELGGGTGVLSYFAAQRAEKVWCVERNPALARAARGFLDQNQHGDRVEVVQADALDYVPPEPVDVVICEMLHVAMVREKQVQVLRAFKENYQRVHGPRLPVFLPDATLMGFQLLEREFNFHGYFAPVPMFQHPGEHPSTHVLSEPQSYSTIFYGRDIPTRFEWDGEVVVQHAGELNALGFLTNNFLAFLLREQRAITWMMSQLVLPLPEPLQVRPGDMVAIRLSYDAGCPLEHLQESLQVERAAVQMPRRRAA